MANYDEQALLCEVRDRLVKKFEQVPADRISTAVTQAHRRFEGSRVRDFIPLLVERRVSDDLTRGTLDADRELASHT